MFIVNDFLCKFCGCTTPKSASIFTRDFMFKGKDEYKYRACDNCDSLQLANVPGNCVAYPVDYYAHENKAELKTEATWLEAQWAKHSAGQFNIVGMLISWYKGSKHLTVKRVVEEGVPKNCRILDWGCGNGQCLRMLKALGYTELQGYDPFILSSNIPHDGTIRFFNELMYPVNCCSVLISSHSIEHMSDPQELNNFMSLGLYADRNNGGYWRVIIQCPIVEGEPGLCEYMQYWVGLDAPRHLNIPSDKGIRALFRGLKFRRDVDEGGYASYISSLENRHGNRIVGWTYVSLLVLARLLKKKAPMTYSDMRAYIIGPEEDIKAKA